MKSAAIVAVCLASVAVAQPHVGHRRRAHPHRAHEKRAVQTAWVTEWVTETVTELVDETTTEFITPTHAPVIHTTSTPVPAEFYPSSSVAPQPSPESPTPTPQYVPETTSTPAPAAVVPETPTYVPPTESTAVYVPPAATSAAAAPSTGGGSSPSGTQYTGDLTYYAVGMGACGIDDSGKDQTDNIVAISKHLMGAQSNGNPMCGKTITISYNGVNVNCVVHDKCDGCALSDIDVSEAAFKKIFGDLGVGRKSVNWWFND